MEFLLDGPKLKDYPFNNFCFFSLSASIKYPLIISNTCCHGLVEFGFLIINFLFFDQFLIISGSSLPSDQSPPPIIFPALAIPIL